MFRTLIASVLIAASPAAAAPFIGLVESSPGRIALQITIDAVGSTASELAVSMDNTLEIVPDTVEVGPLFDVPIPGGNPFTGGVSVGLTVDLLEDTIFAAYASGVLSDLNTPLDYLIFEVSGSGTVQATGVVGLSGVTNEGLSASLVVGGSILGDFDDDSDADVADLLEWQREDGTPQGLSDWRTGFGTGEAISAALAVPEQSSMVLGVLVLGLFTLRRSS